MGFNSEWHIASKLSITSGFIYVRHLILSLCTIHRSDQIEFPPRSHVFSRIVPYFEYGQFHIEGFEHILLACFFHW